MDIVIISQYLFDIENFDSNNSRFVYLAKLLSENPNNEIEIVTSDYNHFQKRHFEHVGSFSNVKVTAIHESGYSKNICFKRFASHKELAGNIKKYLHMSRKSSTFAPDFRKYALHRLIRMFSTLLQFVNETSTNLPPQSTGK